MVAYEIDYGAASPANTDNGGRPCLLRAGKAMTWSNTGFMGLDATGLPISFYGGAFPTAVMPIASSTPSDFDVLAPGVIRVVIGFQLYPDNLTANLTDGTWTAPSASGGGWGTGTAIANAQARSSTIRRFAALFPTGGTAANAVSYIDLKRIAAIVVGVVAINADSAKTATSGQILTIAQQFAQPTNGVLPLNSWTSVADGLASNNAVSSVPLSIRQAVHVFQQTFPITPYGMKGN